MKGAMFTPGQHTGRGEEKVLWVPEKDKPGLKAVYLGRLEACRFCQKKVKLRFRD